MRAVLALIAALFAAPAYAQYSCGAGYRGGPPYVEHGNSIVLYRYSTVQAPKTCAEFAQSRQCLDAKLMGDPEYDQLSCTVTGSDPPTPNTQTQLASVPLEKQDGPYLFLLAVIGLAGALVLLGNLL